MKKLSLILLCALCASSAFAQKNLVESAEKEVKGFSPNFEAARSNIKPALENAETKDDAKTWFVAGKIEFGFYDNQLGKKSINPAEVNDVNMATALLQGYDYLKAALPLDSVKQVDKKTGEYKIDKKTGLPKVKTKYSKDIVGMISGHFNDFSQAGSIFYDNKDYKKAYEAWGIYAELPYAEYLGKNKPEVPDTIVGQIEFFQGIAAWQGEMNDKAVKAFASARSHGYVQKEAFDYALACYVGLNDNDAIVALAKEALPLYGDKDSQYISILINDYINKAKYEEASNLLDQAIAANPENAEFYDVKGTLYEQLKDNEKALEFFQKATEINPEYAKAQFNVGRYYYNKAVKINESADKNFTAAQFAAFFEEKVKPYYIQALPYMEKAYQIDNTNSDVKYALRNLYYQLGDEEKLNALEQGY